MRVFIDTGFFAAFADTSDRFNTTAHQLIEERILSQRGLLHTSNFVLAETYTLIRSRAGHRCAVAFMHNFPKTNIKVFYVTREIEEKAKAIFTKYSDKAFSFVDCTSFILIDLHRLDHALSFDRHFAQYRFKRTVKVLPS